MRGIMERDAFGREQGEDSLAGMGWSSSMGSTPTPTPTPAPVAQPAMSAGDLPPTGPAPQRPVYTRRRRRGGGLGFIVLLIFVTGVAVSVGGALTAFNAGSDALKDITSTIDEATNGTSTTTTTTTTGSGGASLLGAKAFRAALAKLPDGDVTTHRVARDRIDATIIVDGRLHAVQVTADGGLKDIRTPGTQGGDAVGKVNSAAPSRIARTAARRAGRPVSEVDYLVLVHILGKDQWQLFFKDGTHFSGSADGRHVRKVG
jgi:hypothetical protein